MDYPWFEVERCTSILKWLYFTGTILHPQKIKKERLPLAELLSNLPKYPVASSGTELVCIGGTTSTTNTSQGQGQASKVVPYRSNDAWSRSTRDHSRRYVMFVNKIRWNTWVGLLAFWVVPILVEIAKDREKPPKLYHIVPIMHGRGQQETIVAGT